MRWPVIYSTWMENVRGIRGNYGTGELASFKTVEYTVKRQAPAYGWLHGQVGIGWEPGHAHPDKVESINAGPWNYTSTPKGILRTAELLFENRNNMEKQAAVLILASINTKLSSWPYEWQNGANTMAHDLYNNVNRAFPDMDIWHHASRELLPVTLGKDSLSGSLIHPNCEDELIYLFALEAVLSLDSWQLIKYVPFRDQVAAAEPKTGAPEILAVKN